MGEVCDMCGSTSAGDGQAHADACGDLARARLRIALLELDDMKRDGAENLRALVGSVSKERDDLLVKLRCRDSLLKEVTTERDMLVALLRRVVDVARVLVETFEVVSGDRATS
jgi:hypothetical protein